MAIITISLDVEVTVPQLVWDKALDLIVNEQKADDQAGFESMCGTRERPKLGPCLAMLLDRSEHLGGGAQIQQHTIEGDDEEEEEPTIRYRLFDIDWDDTDEELGVEQIIEATLKVPERLCPPAETDMGAWFIKADATIPTTEDAKKALNFIDWVNDWLDDNEGCMHSGWKVERLED